jgi:hypothetical protein
MNTRNVGLEKFLPIMNYVNCRVLLREQDVGSTRDEVVVTHRVVVPIHQPKTNVVLLSRRSRVSHFYALVPEYYSQ